MHVRNLALIPAVVLLMGVTVPATAAQSDSGMLSGRVTADSAPLPSTLVYAYQLADLSLRKVVTDPAGRFLFDSLPAGLYKIIAFKPGFVPTVVRLARASAGLNQFLEVQLQAETAAAADSASDFWTAREQIPPDVLRQLLKPEQVTSKGPGAQLNSDMIGPINGSMSLMTGMEASLIGDAPLTAGRIDLASRVHDLHVGLSGNFQMLGMSRLDNAAADQLNGSTNDVSLTVQSDNDATLQVSSRNNRLVTDHSSIRPMDLQHIQVRWSQPIGQNGHSKFLARYTEESNFYRQGLLSSSDLPLGSQSWYVEGSYSTPITERSTVEAGMRYRARDSYYGAAGLPIDGGLTDTRMDLYGQGGLRLAPEMLLEYGMVSSMEDGQFAVAPRGGFVFQMGPYWQTSAVASKKVSQGNGLTPVDFLATHYDELASCDQVQEYCYQVTVSRDTGDDEGFTVGAVDRRFDDSVRLYFDDDFFRQFENLYLVRGDRLPELRFTLTRRITPQILARVSSSAGSGGGGEARLKGNHAYENQVSFLVTTLETRFKKTETGVALTFQQLSQQLDPIGITALPSRRGETERMQLLLSQDLNSLIQLAAQWAVQLNMEFSRGDLAQGVADHTSDLHRRITGGVSVRF